MSFRHFVQPLNTQKPPQEWARFLLVCKNYFGSAMRIFEDKVSFGLFTQHTHESLYPVFKVNLEHEKFQFLPFFLMSPSVGWIELSRITHNTYNASYYHVKYTKYCSDEGKYKLQHTKKIFEPYFTHQATTFLEDWEVLLEEVEDDEQFNEVMEGKEIFVKDPVVLQSLLDYWELEKMHRHQ